MAKKVVKASFLKQQQAKKSKFLRVHTYRMRVGSSGMFLASYDQPVHLADWDLSVAGVMAGEQVMAFDIPGVKKRDPPPPPPPPSAKGKLGTGKD